MSEKKIALAKAYYEAMAHKNIALLETFLHSEVELVTPLFGVISGKESVLQSVKNFSAYFNTLFIRELFEKGDKAMVVYDVDFPSPIGSCRSASLLTFQGDKIARCELFYDARPFEKK